jgi:hypothetical protein
MKSRKFDEGMAGDYEKLTVWWQLHNWPTPPLECLPPTGFIVEHEGQDIAAGFLYLTDSEMCLLEYVVGNPLCDKIVRGNALDLLISTLLAEASYQGRKFVFSSIMHPSLIERYKKHGGIATESNMTNFIWRL